MDTSRALCQARRELAHKEWVRWSHELLAQQTKDAARILKEMERICAEVLGENDDDTKS